MTSQTHTHQSFWLFYLQHILEILSGWTGDRAMFKLETKGSWQTIDVKENEVVKWPLCNAVLASIQDSN